METSPFQPLSSTSHTSLCTEAATNSPFSVECTFDILPAVVTIRFISRSLCHLSRSVGGLTAQGGCCDRCCQQPAQLTSTELSELWQKTAALYCILIVLFEITPQDLANMAWYSILPADLTYLETWAARIFVRYYQPPAHF